MSDEGIVKNTIFIDMILCDEIVNTTTYLKDPVRLKDESKMSISDLNMWDDLIDSVISVLNDYEFDIIEHHQSGKSYSYYVSFYPTSEDGLRFDEPVKIVFRLSNHRNDQDHSSNKIKRAFFKSFELDGEQYSNPVDIFFAIDEICKELQKGNYSVLY